MTTDYETIAAASPPEAVIPSRRGGLAGRLALAALALYCAWAIAGLFGRAAEIQDDFFVCYTAAKAQQAGISPYDTEALTRISGGRVVWPYFYSPLAAYAFRPLAALEMRTAARVWLGLKLLAVAALILIWRNVILGGKVDAFFYFFCALGFNATIYIDLAGVYPLLTGYFPWFITLAVWMLYLRLIHGGAPATRR